MAIGVPSALDTNLSLYFDLEADLVAFTDGVPIGTCATAGDTGNTFIWNGTTWKSLNGVTTFTGGGVPAASAGANGDLYFDFDSDAIYSKSGGAWSFNGNLGGPGPRAFDRYVYAGSGTSSAPSVDPGSGNIKLYGQLTGGVSATTRILINTTNALGTSYHLAQAKKLNTYIRVSKASDSSQYLTCAYQALHGSGAGFEDWSVNVVDAFSGSLSVNDVVIVSWIRAPGSWNYGAGAASTTAPLSAEGEWFIDTTDSIISQYTGGLAAPGWNAVFTVPTPAVGSVTGANPAATTSTAEVMLGLAGAITPVTTEVKVQVEGAFNVSGTATRSVTVQIRYGTGTAPANGTAVSGTSAGTAVATKQTFQNPATSTWKIPFALSAIVTGLSPATVYWLDVAVSISSSSSTLTFTTVNITAHDI